VLFCAVDENFYEFVRGWGGRELRFCYSAEAEYLAIITEQVLNILQNFGRRLSMSVLGKMKIQNDCLNICA